MFKTLRYLAFTLIFGLGSIAAAQAAPSSCAKPWPAWEAFKKGFISKEGRVVDGSSEEMKTTSEGQSYALFFSLVANDRETFDKLLSWTETNLAEGDLTTRLPAWAWGKNDAGNWGVLDDNSASDADLWIAYALGEAGRLWANRRYVAMSSLMANRILSAETREVAKLGLVLLPGTTGFTPTATSVRLNPSYVPLQLMRWFTAHSKDPRWASLLNSSRRLILESSSEGYAPDWTIYDESKGFQPDRADDKSGIGSYDAIRVYLWAGMLSRDDADRQALLDALKPMARFVEERGYPPQSIHTRTGAAGNPGSSGFSAAMLPLLQAEGMGKAVESQLLRIEAQPVTDDSYYDQVLSLFALGWHDNLYRFDFNGNLTPRWMFACK
ncbi:MAG TPA: cellulose synthase complex periplasmic endoglucanase BcsZ [Gallionella sp.]|nr:cellulose synthase complex periplasmic endoglucanase BcsZ [Gallionella sp.]